MTTKRRNAPTISVRGISLPENFCKDRGKFPVIQAWVYELFCRGGKYSVADISKALGLSDPRGHIKYLRGKGINIKDEWRNGAHGGKYKVYWLEKEDQEW